MPILRVIRTIVTVVAVFAPIATAQDPKLIELTGRLLDRLPSAYRDISKQVVALPEKTQQSWLEVPSGNLMLAMISQIAVKPEGIDFLVARLEKEESPDWRVRIIEVLSSYWRTHPEKQIILERHALSDPSADVSLHALEVLRSIRMTDLAQLLEKRMAAARDARDTMSLNRLLPEEERWLSLKRGTMLPAFLRTPPPVFSVKAADQPIRVLAFGDFGTGSPAQVDLAKTMVAYHKAHPFDFGITLGDNFYLAGMMSPNDPRWQTQWEQLYGLMNIKFYASLGNHDWVTPDSPAAEILYSEKSPDWRMPAPYYTYTAGPVQFFVTDGIGSGGLEFSQAQLDWLDAELGKSKAQWKIVYGHFPIYSAQRGVNPLLSETLLPILKKRHADVYMNGHDHNLQELNPEDGVHFFISGGGGVGLAEMNPYDRTAFKKMLYGFTVLEANQSAMDVIFIGMDGQELYRRKIERRP
jgi:hypothetical protein